MNEDVFTRRYKRDWERLEQLLSKARRGLPGFDGGELDSLVSLNSKVSGHLAYSRTYFPASATTFYLNRLVGRSHGIIYASGRKGIGNPFVFFLFAFPETVRRNMRYILLSAGIFAACALFSGIAVSVSKDNALAFLPESVINGINPAGTGDSWDGAVMSSFIFTNNIKVGLMAFALGITLGAGTIIILAYNGVMLGSVTALCMHAGGGAAFWALILPHGIIELFCIFVCGGSGLIIGYSIINPHKFSRKDSLVLRGREAIRMVAGTVPLFVIAGLIEGYVTPSGIGTAPKLAFAAFTSVLLFLYAVLPKKRA